MNKLSILLVIILMQIVIGCNQSKTTVTTTDTTTTATSNKITDALILPFVEAFQTKYATTVTLPVYFDSSSSTGSAGSSGITIGLCRIYSNGYREILINQDWWTCKTKNSSGVCTALRPDSEKRILVFHELGHCVFNRDHDFELTSSNAKICLSSDASGNCVSYKYRTFVSAPTRPISMMYPIINNIADFYGLNQSYYEYELAHAEPQAWDTVNLSTWQIAYNNYVSSTPLAMIDTGANPGAILYQSMASDLSLVQDASIENSEPTSTNDGCVEFVE